MLLALSPASLFAAGTFIELYASRQVLTVKHTLAHALASRAGCAGVKHSGPKVDRELLLHQPSADSCKCVQMPDAWMEQKRQAVMKYRNLFIYTTAPQDEPSASDALIDLMCSHAKFGGFQES